MSPEVVVAIVAVAVSFTAIVTSVVLSTKALREARRTNELSLQMATAADASAKAAIDQTELQRHQTDLQSAMVREASAPYVWVDIRPDAGSAQLAMLVVGNSGPTVATHVVVTFDPPLQSVSGARSGAHEAERRLNAGLSSLPPGRTLEWTFGTAHEVYGSEWTGPASFDVTVAAEGPHGDLAPLRYRIAMDDVRHNRASPPGTLHSISRAVDQLTKEIGQLRKARR